MKRGIYVDRIVSDPRKGNPGFGKTRASEEGYLLDRYFKNMEILAELEKKYGVMTCNNIMTAAGIVEARTEMFDFMITHVPPRSDARDLAARRNARRNRSLEGLAEDERQEEIRKWMGEEDGFLNTLYGLSLHALKRVKAKSPNTTIIAYTGAPGPIRRRCVEEGLADHLIHRDRYGAGLELEWIKDILAGGSGMYDPHEAAAENLRKMMRGGEDGA